MDVACALASKADVNVVDVSWVNVWFRFFVLGDRTNLLLRDACRKIYSHFCGRFCSEASVRRYSGPFNSQ